MSIPKPKMPQPPAAAPIIAPLEPAKQELGGGTTKSAKQLRAMRGRSALRIDPQTGGSRLSSSGVSIPVA